jgi:hypothetical protein
VLFWWPLSPHANPRETPGAPVQILGRVAGSLRLGRRATTAATNGEEAAEGPDGAGQQNPASGRRGR